MRYLYSAVATTTGKKLLRNTLGLAAVLCVAAVPGYCSTSFLSYTGSWTTLPGSPGNNITIDCTSNCGNETLSSFSVPVTQLTVSNAADAADNGQWTITGGTEVYALSGSTVTMTVSGTIGTCGTCVGGNLGGVNGALTTVTYTGLAGGMPFNSGSTDFTTGGTGNKNFTLNLGAATSVSDLGTLLSDLGETATVGSVTTSPTSGANGAGSSDTGNGTHVYNLAGSTTLGITLTSTPEPVSFILFGTGLMAVGLIARRRRVSQN
jgi:hypothetical protein